MTPCLTFSGSGGTAIFSSDLFKRRIELVKAYAVTEKHRIQVLYGLQCAVAKLSHPPSKQFLSVHQHY